MTQPSTFLVSSFTLLVLLVALAYPIGVFLAYRRKDTPKESAVRHALIVGGAMAAWLAATALLAASGALQFGPMPPRLALLMIVATAAAVWFSRSETGRTMATGLPLALLVGVQAFRFPLELIMHRAYSEGVMPVQMSYSGWNFDIVTGVSAIVVAGLIAGGRMPLWGIRLWNWVGCLLLLNVVVIAWLSVPGPLQVFTNEPPNVWVTTAPFVWLPTVLVMTALIGHLLVFRRMKHDARLAT